MAESTADVIVIGAGPAGTTAASLLARRGRDVRIFDKSVHPRFHIGESLLPNNLSIFERLGVLEDVRQIGVYKPAAEFITVSGKRQVFPFSRALGDTPPHAYQVRRSELDEILARNCQAAGARLEEGCEVVDVAAQSGGTLHRVTIQRKSGASETIMGRYVLDASGRDVFLARKNGWHQRNRRHASAAIFSHFENVAVREGEDAGNISVYWFEHGWAWMIPLRNGVMSVGAVCRPDYLKHRRSSPETFLMDTLRSIPDARERLRNAQAVAPTHVTGNYSYSSSTMVGDGYALIGDAYAFVDPVFSSGVYLAMNSAERSVPMIEAWLDENLPQYRRERKAYERRVAAKLTSFTWFIYRFTSPVMRGLFEAPRNDWQVEQAVVSMLAGDGDEHAFIRRRLAIFKGIYTLSMIRHLGTAVSAWWARKRRNTVPFDEETLL